MSRKRSPYSTLLAPIGVVLVLTLGVLAPLQAQGPAPNPPLAPVPKVSASDCTYTSRIRITWTARPTAVDYFVLRSATMTGLRVPACSSTGLFCDDITVPVNRPHYYWVYPQDSHGVTGAPAGPDVGTRRGPGPAAPTGLDATDGTYDDFVRLTWDDHADTPKYHLRRGESSGGPFVRVVSGLETNEYDDTSAAPGVTYYYNVQGEDHCDQEGPWSAQTKGYRAVGPLPAPTNLEASDCIYEDKVRLVWDAVEFAAKYRVLRADTYTGTKNKLADVLGTHYDDHPPELNETYYYWVQTCTNATCTILSDYSNSDKGKRCCDPPPVPTNVAASDGTHEDKVVVTWDASVGATSYKVYRATTSTGTGIYQATVTATSWEDTTGDAGTPYYYMVTACSECGCSEDSPADAGHRGSAPPVTIYSYVPLVLR